MKTHVGILDKLFGVRVTLNLPQPDGKFKQVQVTKKWFDKMQHEQKVRPISKPVVAVHIFGSAGDFVQHWVVGEQVTEEQYQKFLDRETGDLYAVQSGQDVCLVRRDLWEDAQKV
jgi:hypothetical protein